MATEDFEKLTRELADSRAASERVGVDGGTGDFTSVGRREPRLDVDALVAIMDRERPQGADPSRQERLRALRAWREALVRRHELRQRAPRPEEADGGPFEVSFAAEPFSEESLGELERSGQEALDLRGLERAAGHAAIDRVIPPFSHRGFLTRALARWVARGVSFMARFVTIRQSLVNSILIEYAAETGHRLNLQQERLDRLVADAERLVALERQQTAARLWELQSAATALGRGMDRLQRQAMETRSAALDRELELADLECAKTWSQVAELDAREEFGRLRGLLSGLASRLASHEARVGEREAREAGHEARWSEQSSRLDTLREELDAIRATLEKHAERLAGQRSASGAIQELLARTDSLEESLADLEREPDESRVEDAARSESTGHLGAPLDGLYVNLENQFRGSRELIAERLTSYLPLVAECGAGTVDHPILDLGSGRGEWLELLRSRGLSARGVEINSVAVSNCRSLGLDVTAADALEFLRQQPSRSVGLVSAFHLLEHLPFDGVVELLGESLRVLEPGGVALFETPNPENLVVAAKSFHCDPTHQKPLVPELLVFLMQQQGFADLRIERQTQGRPDDRLEPLAESDPQAARLNPIIALLNRHFAAPSDFAVVGYRSA